MWVTLCRAVPPGRTGMLWMKQGMTEWIRDKASFASWWHCTSYSVSYRHSTYCNIVWSHLSNAILLGAIYILGPSVCNWFFGKERCLERLGQISVEYCLHTLCFPCPAVWLIDCSSSVEEQNYRSVRDRHFDRELHRDELNRESSVYFAGSLYFSVPTSRCGFDEGRRRGLTV